VADLALQERRDVVDVAVERDAGSVRTRFVADFFAEAKALLGEAAVL
jgi:hypothetical protein